MEQHLWDLALFGEAAQCASPLTLSLSPVQSLSSDVLPQRRRRLDSSSLRLSPPLSASLHLSPPLSSCLTLSANHAGWPSTSADIIRARRCSTPAGTTAARRSILLRSTAGQRRCRLYGMSNPTLTLALWLTLTLTLTLTLAVAVAVAVAVALSLTLALSLSQTLALAPDPTLAPDPSRVEALQAPRACQYQRIVP